MSESGPRSPGQSFMMRVTRNPRRNMHWFSGRFYSKARYRARGLSETWGHANVEQKTHLATGAKLQIPTRHASLLQTDAGIPGRLRYERYPCACAVLGEEDTDPRSREMTPGDENDVLHAVDPQAEVVGDLHAVVDVLD
jgi:hypothetical protein